MSRLSSEDFSTDLTYDELKALVSAGNLVLTHRWLMTRSIPVGEALLRAGVRKLDGLLAAVEPEAARTARKRANDR